MSATVVLCGSKRSFFEDLPPSPSPPYLSKRLRCSSSSTTSSADESTIQHFWVPYVLSQLRSLFPNMHPQVLERSLQESGYDLDATVKSLNDLAKKQKDFSSSAKKVEQLPLDGPRWIDLAIGDMASDTSVNDARNERYKEHEGRDQELKNLKDLVDQQKEQLRKLEIYKYGLQLQLNEALKNNYSCVPAGRFNPDVF
ncbi:uncharacterized protein LOC133730249 [Rosa rugosa]|uniref:uncharacterized protein LOC133730249 n=1 Tax=Rosa rugosa TaxID=74645 RepID=UPI002B411F9B|nr:uncharacterized protein LOC133730249 [Rosa rugosa]